MYDIPWSKPVHLEFSRRSTRIVDGPVAALALLDRDWPVRSGRH